MSWNYRILVKVYTNGLGETEIAFSMHEVYYKKTGKPRAYSTEPISPHGESLTGVRKDLTYMRKALSKPILYWGDKFPKEYKLKKK